MSVSRRQLLSLGALGGATALLAACSTPGTTSPNTGPTIPAADGVVRLQYWAWLKDLQKVCDVWNADHPDIQVEAVWLPGGNGGAYQKMYSGLAAGGGPDIAQIEMRGLPAFLLANGLIDLTRYGFDEHESSYNTTLWKQVSFTGGVYGVPQDSGPMATYFRPDLLEKVGATSTPETWDDWAALGKELRGADSYIDCFPLSDASWFTALATQAGASWLTIDEDRWTIDMTDDATLEVAAFFDKAIDDGIVTTAYTQYSPGWFAAAADDRVATLTSASWGDALLEGVSGGSGKWRVGAMPTWSGEGYASSYIGGSTAAVLANSRHPKEATEFATWMTTSKAGIDAMIRYCGIGWSPSDDYIGKQRMTGSEFFGGQNYNEEVFVPAAREQNDDWQWWPLTEQSFNILADGFREKASGGTLVQAVKDAETRIITTFREKGLRIEKARA